MMFNEIHAKFAEEGNIYCLTNPQSKQQAIQHINQLGGSHKLKCVEITPFMYSSLYWDYVGHSRKILNAPVQNRWCMSFAIVHNDKPIALSYSRPYNYQNKPCRGEPLFFWTHISYAPALLNQLVLDAACIRKLLGVYERYTVLESYDGVVHVMTTPAMRQGLYIQEFGYSVVDATVIERDGNFLFTCAKKLIG